MPGTGRPARSHVSCLPRRSRQRATTDNPHKQQARIPRGWGRAKGHPRGTRATVAGRCGSGGGPRRGGCAGGNGGREVEVGAGVGGVAGAYLIQDPAPPRIAAVLVPPPVLR